MVHISEEKFADKVEADLTDVFGGGPVERELALPTTGRVVDLYVETPSAAADLAIELENDFESAFEAHGQAQFYAHQLGAHPIILVPPGHFEIPEAFYLAACGVDIFQYPLGDTGGG